MKRTAAAFVLAAGLGGCMSPSSGDKTMGTKADGTAARTASRAESGQVMQAGGRTMSDPKRDAAVMHANAYGVDGMKGGRMVDGNVRQANFGGNGPAPGPEAYGPMQRGIGTALGHGGITPAPGMGPAGAVAVAPGSLGMGGMGGAGGMYANGRTSVRFAAPVGMKIAFMDASRGFAEAGREAPVRYNFVQGNIYRVRLNGIPNRPGKNYYPTLEIYPPASKEAMTFLSHATVPIGFTDEDFDQVNAGNMVVKVIYLPSAQFQDVAAAEEIVSTRLEPGTDPVAEAGRRGTVLAVIRVGNIDLEDPTTPAMDMPPGMSGPRGGGMVAPPPMPMSASSGPSMPAPMADVKLPEMKTADDKKVSVPASLPTIKLPPVK
jgi:hypothetical protein